MACFTPIHSTIIFFTRLGAQCCEACRAVREGEYANGAKHGYYYYNYYCDNELVEMQVATATTYHYNTGH